MTLDKDKTTERKKMSGKICLDNMLAIYGFFFHLQNFEQQNCLPQEALPLRTIVHLRIKMCSHDDTVCKHILYKFI